MATPDDHSTAVLAIAQGLEMLRLAGERLPRLFEQLERLAAHAPSGEPSTVDAGPAAYDEPGPSAVRKWFERTELYARWGVGKAKLQELETLGALPAWRPGPQKVLYFWAYVWAYEGRMTSGEAHRIFHDHQGTAAGNSESTGDPVSPSLRLIDKDTAL